MALIGYSGPWGKMIWEKTEAENLQSDSLWIKLLLIEDIVEATKLPDAAVVSTGLILFLKYLANFWLLKIHRFLRICYMDFTLFWCHFIVNWTTN